MTPKIEKILARYLTNSATITDLDTLSEWIKTPRNHQVFKDYVRTHYAINKIMNNEDSDETIEKLLRTIRKDKSIGFRIKNQSFYKYAIAASIVLLISLGFWFKQNNFNETQHMEPIIVNNNIKTGYEKATLTLEDGSTIILEKETDYQTQNASSNGEHIVYKDREPEKKEVAYNYLTIPIGGQFKITLSDGTKVWLNSESQLKYPVTFTDGDMRKVELVYGEAYFDVSPSTAHRGSIFKVINNAQEVEVLGTEFNIKAYQNESKIFTTLIEGKVAISAFNKNEILEPNQQLQLNLTSSNLTVSSETDVYREIAWKSGVFSFKNKPLKDIMIVLSRWYDIDVVFENKALRSQMFNGKFDKKQSIVEILNIISKVNNISYEINDKTVILK